ARSAGPGGSARDGGSSMLRRRMVAGAVEPPRPASEKRARRPAQDCELPDRRPRWRYSAAPGFHVNPRPRIMSLHDKLLQRAADGRPIRIALVGAGKFGSMYLAQAPRMPGVHVVGIADLAPDRARANLDRVGWKPGQAGAGSIEEAIRDGTDRKSTRLNSSHVQISYAVFCLKK